MTNHRCQHNLTLVRLKMELDKEHIRHYLLFCFHQKKNTTGAHRIICETYGENVIAIRTCANWFKRFKNSNFVISDATLRNCLQLWKRTNCGKMRKSWKTRIMINLYCIDFFIVIKNTKNTKNWQELLHLITIYQFNLRSRSCVCANTWRLAGSCCGIL